MIILTIVIGVLPFFFVQLSYQLVLAVFAITLFGVLVVWKKPLSKKLLYINNLLLIFASLCITHILIFVFALSTDSLIGVLAGVAIMDFISFTRAGRITLNAKLVGNMNLLARFSIVLPVPKKPGLQPIIGVGDLTYYSLITMFFLKTDGITAGLISALIIFVGQCVNIIFIAIMKKRQWAKGFPATMFPGLFILIAIFFNICSVR
jgi:hypothetical protein